MRASIRAAVCLILAGTAAGQTVYETGTTIWKPAKTFNGLTLFAAPGEWDALLIDMRGKVVTRWSSPVPGERVTHLSPLDDGHILFLSHDGSNPHQTAYELDASGNVVWSFTLNPSQGHLHHDLQRLPNGHTLLLGAQTITVPAISPLPIEDDFLVEVDRSGTVVWSWFAWQHFGELGFSTAQKALIASTGGAWAHVNAIDSFPPNAHTDPAFQEGNIVISQRFTNILLVIDKATGSIVWKAGPDDNVSWGQHSVHMIREGLTGAGNLLLFDNGSGTGYLATKRAPGYSRILELDPVTTSTAWAYDASRSGLRKRTFWSDIVSGAQRLENGNTLICSGLRGRLFEVTVMGEIVWEYMSPYSGIVSSGANSHMIFRAHRLPPDWAYLPYVDPLPGG
jgi:hypothetical protein